MKLEIEKQINKLLKQEETMCTKDQEAVFHAHANLWKEKEYCCWDHCRRWRLGDKENPFMWRFFLGVEGWVKLRWIMPC